MKRIDDDMTRFMAQAEAACFDKPWTEDEIRAAAENEYGVCVVEDGTGYAIGRMSFDEAELYRIGVLPGKRRNGAGGRLLGRFVSECAARGAEKIFLEVRAKNDPAIKLYEKHGFTKISVRKGYYGDDDAVIYVLDTKNSSQFCS